MVLLFIKSIEYNQDIGEMKFDNLDKLLEKKFSGDFDFSVLAEIDSVRDNNRNFETSEQSIVNLKVHGVQLNVTDMAIATDFYSKKIGFQIISETKNRVELQNAGINLILNRVMILRKNNFKEETRTGLVLHTNSLDSVIINYRKKDIKLTKEKTENGVGYDIMIEDPFGNSIAIMEQSKYPVPRFKEPKIYNVGYVMNDINKAKEFYCDELGFNVRTMKYLPAIPLGHRDSTFAFMLHKMNVKPVKLHPNETQTMIIFESENMNATIDQLQQRGITITTLSSSDGLESYFLKDPFGNLSKLINSE